jgi:2-dehydro-3-deoxy-L-rhamnonate dehydrogenase (NAD+)
MPSSQAPRIAVVTGAAGGMGQAITAQLLSDGLHVTGIDIDGAALSGMAADLGPAFTPETADLTDPAAIAACFARIAARSGGIDALVNNAGTCFMSDFPDIPAAELDRQMAVNFSSAFHCCQAAVKAMLGRPGIRKIVNISSNGAYNFDVFDPPHYRASKAAMDTLTKDLARRYAAEGIAANSLAPAMTETPLFNVLTEDVLARALAAMPRGHAMQASEIAAWVGFLISPAGDVSSGNVIILNQGRDVR